MNEYALDHRGYYIKPKKEHPYCYVISTIGKGGTIPDSLSGMYTTKTLAKTDIDNYLNNKPVKEENNGETINKGRSK
jgi:hypothetical protein